MSSSALNIRLLLPTVAFAASVPSLAAADYEEPAYEILGETDVYELRSYRSYLVAEVIVSGDFGDAGNTAFRILAGYIFGDNSAAESMQMTTPVESRPAGESVEMAMTVPVFSSSAAAERYVYRFVMERKYSLETLPRPNDERITIREVPSRTMAVHRFSGFWSERNYRRHETLLLSALTTDNVETRGVPLLARYNGPFTPWFLRRNEVMIEIDPASLGARERR